MVVCCYAGVVVDVDPGCLSSVLYDAFVGCTLCDGFDTFVLFYVGFGDWSSMVLGVYDGDESGRAGLSFGALEFVVFRNASCLDRG